MTFEINKSLEILKRTPSVLDTLLTDLSKDWTQNNEGENTWSPYEVLGHLIHGEKTDWIPRAKIILSDSENKTFESFDRFAQQNEDQNQTIEDLLSTFKKLRATNLETFESFNLTDTLLEKEGIHPELGKVNLKQLLSCWVAHDLGHIAQITRVMAKQYKTEVGPWLQYMGIMK